MLHFSLNRAVLDVGTSDQVIENEQAASLLGSSGHNAANIVLCRGMRRIP